MLVIMTFAQLRATHIVGGEITYKYLSNNNYTLRLDLFIDCINGNPDAIAQDLNGIFVIFNANGEKINQYEVKRTGPSRVEKLNYECLERSPNACVDWYNYVVNVTLPPITGGYIVSFQRCCRNNSITNLNDPGGTGANYWTTVPDARMLANQIPNNSAVFKELPPNFLCTNAKLVFDHHATDPDGDSLVYELFHPFTAGERPNPRPDGSVGRPFDLPPFTEITFNTGYNASMPINGNPALKIDRKTGLLTLVPTKVGQFVVGIRVLEFRKGMLISETKRDYQFNVQVCDFNVVASYFVPKYICGYTYQFQNTSKGATQYKWDFGVPNTDDDKSNKISPKFTFPGAGKYWVKLISYDGNCVDSIWHQLEVLAPMPPQLGPDTVICPGQTVKLQSSIIMDSYKWNTGATTNSIQVNTAGLYYLDATVKTCTWRDTLKVIMDNRRIQISGDTTYCEEAVFARILSVNTQDMMEFVWSNGATTREITVDKPGHYWASGITSYSCPSRDTAYVKQFPAIELNLRDSLVCPGNTVTFDCKIVQGQILWSTGQNTRVINLKTPGIYSITVTRDVCKKSQYFELSNHVDYFDLGPDLRFCESIDTFLYIEDPQLTNITWNEAFAGRQFHLLQPGRVHIFLKNKYGCPEQDSLMVRLYPNPSLQMPRDTVVCASIHPVLDGGPDMLSYRWQDGSGERLKTAMDEGLYWCEIHDHVGCFTRDSIFIEKDPNLFPNIVYMPNAFTPNDDGRNDLYPKNQYFDFGAKYNVKLYNRWGEKVAEYNSPDGNWDGLLKGNPAPEGVYIYLVDYIGCDNTHKRLYGDFHLLR